MAELPFATIRVSGDDAFEFLQGQLTQDLARLGKNATPAPLLSAWCNPKGRVICLLRVSQTDDGFALALPAELAAEVTRRLTLFRFRSKVDFETRPASARELGTTLDADAWRTQNLAAGIAEIGLAQTEEYTPHMLNLDLLDAVSLDKGCYTGQEIVARTHYRGASRRRLRRFACDAEVGAGEAVMLADRRVGGVVNSIGRELLAVVPVEPADGEFRCAGHTLERLPLPYTGEESR